MKAVYRNTTEEPQRNSARALCHGRGPTGGDCAGLREENGEDSTALALGEEFALASAVIDARNRAGLTQQALARKMGTTQPVVARLESGRTRPSMRTLERLAKATGSRLLIRFEPRERKRAAG